METCSITEAPPKIQAANKPDVISTIAAVSGSVIPVLSTAMAAGMAIAAALPSRASPTDDLLTTQIPIDSLSLPDHSEPTNSQNRPSNSGPTTAKPAVPKPAVAKPSAPSNPKPQIDKPKLSFGGFGRRGGRRG